MFEVTDEWCDNVWRTAPRHGGPIEAVKHVVKALRIAATETQHPEVAVVEGSSNPNDKVALVRFDTKTCKVERNVENGYLIGIWMSREVLFERFNVREISNELVMPEPKPEGWTSSERSAYWFGHREGVKVGLIQASKDECVLQPNEVAVDREELRATLNDADMHLDARDPAARDLVWNSDGTCSPRVKV